MLITRNNQATAHKEVLYWDNGREKIRVPAGEEVKYFKKEIVRINAANAYAAAQCDQLNDDLKLELDATKAVLVVTDNSLTNARIRIKELSA